MKKIAFLFMALVMLAACSSEEEDGIDPGLQKLKNAEQQAIRNYLRQFEVVNKLPAIDEIKVGENAPFYKLAADGSVYMQLLNRGTAPAASNGERIYFRFLRYNLLWNLQEKDMPEPEGNAWSMDGADAFVIGSDKESTTQWGTGIQQPLLIGLPADCKVNLVVASEAGFVSDIPSVTPYLYQISYYPQAY